MSADNEGLIEVSDDSDDSSLASSSDPESSDGNGTVPAIVGNHRRKIVIYSNHTKFNFLTTKLLLIVFGSALLILFPLFLEANSTHSDAYSLLLQTSLCSSLLLVAAVYLFWRYCAKCPHRLVATGTNSMPFRLPSVQLSTLLQLAGVYAFSGLFILYALDRKRVVCHVQDPLKATLLVFALFYYFIFSKKLMGLRRIFSATAVVGGLFLAVDYGICNEFRCRGFDRRQWSDEGGHWTRQIHWIWTMIYIGGLALFAFYFALLERRLFHMDDSSDQPVSFLPTISGAVSSHSNPNYIQTIGEDLNRENVLLARRYSVLHLSMWIQIFASGFIFLLFWTDFVPSIGQASTISDFFNHLTNGLFCHAKSAPSALNCNRTALIGWLFVFIYLAFFLLSLKFLILSQSAVYTVAVMCVALPLSGIWWGLFQMVPLENGLLLWSPAFNGELVCCLLGLPIVCIGLIYLCKSHFADYRWCRQTMDTSNVPST